MTIACMPRFALSQKYFACMLVDPNSVVLGHTQVLTLRSMCARSGKCHLTYMYDKTEA